MALSYDPDEVPDIPGEMNEAAIKTGSYIVSVICEPGEHMATDAIGAVQFLALTTSIPRIGEMIQTQDGSYCVVTKVIYRVGMRTGFPELSANVIAVRTKQGEAYSPFSS